MNLPNLTPQQFLDKHWQKHLLLIRQAFENFTPPLDPDELAGLACEEEVESRLVIQHPDASPEWTVRQGPFTAKDFAELPPTHWTLLVQDVDKHVPECAGLLDHFRFLPDWRIDDLMISYAAPSGSVGPHIDAYDVFLLQGLGERHWQLDPIPESTAEVPDIGLKLLDNFTSKEDYILSPGDMLYLPPGVAHHGVAQNDCMTLSIGFRAPSHAEMLADFAGWLAAKADPEARYEDPDLTIEEAEGGQISNHARDTIRTTLRSYMQLDDAEMDRWFGCFITEPKPWLVTPPAEQPVEPAELIAALRAGRTLHRSPCARIHYIPKANGALLFCDGEAFEIDNVAAPPAPVLARQRQLKASDLGSALANDRFASLLTDFYNRGKYYFDDE
ncbi:MAG TPA: cupin domain-containing protein [Gammaproteobacteria bacterium]|nr:cupin domain-containing protein [Gammaproteobacteria bacterium]